MAATRVRALARHLSAAPLRAPPTAPLSTAASHAAPKESFIDRVKRAGANAMLGMFVTTGLKFDRVLEGMEVTRVDSKAGEVECVLAVTDKLGNAYGTLHGGVITTLVDVVGTMALLSVDPLRAGVSVELSTSFVSAAKVGESVRVVGKVVKTGKSLGFTQVDIFRTSDGKPVATGRHTKFL
jgi:acyl-coenzyme A thioesterase 13